MNEHDLRALTAEHCARAHPEGSFIRHELGLLASRRRIDLAALDTLLHGYEIKSDDDSLARLPEQAKDYSLVFDRLTLVTTAKHLDPATAIIPTWWGVKTGDDGRLHTVRTSRPNPSSHPFPLAQLLWRAEAFDELTILGVQKGLNKAARHYVWLRLAQVTTHTQLRRIVINRLKSRTGWNGSPP